MKKCIASVYMINVCFWYKQVKFLLSQAEVFEILDLKLASHSLFFLFCFFFLYYQHKIWVSWIICYSESLNVSSLVCQSKSRLPGSYFTGRCKSSLYYILLCFWLVEGIIVFFSVRSWRQHLSFPLSGPPLKPSDWPERQSVSVRAGLEPAVSALL